MADFLNELVFEDLEIDGETGNTYGTRDQIKLLRKFCVSSNVSTKPDEYFYKPLVLLLLPEKYDFKTHTYEPVSEENYDKAKMLIEQGANINTFIGGLTPFGAVLTYSQGKQRNEMLEYLHKKGVSINFAIDLLEENANDDIPESYFALNQFYSYSSNSEVKIELLAFTSLKNPVKGGRFLEAAAKAGHEIAVKIVKRRDEWEDTDSMVKALRKAHPDRVPVALSHEQILKMINDLGLTESSEPPHDIYLTDIQRKWILSSHGIDEEEYRRQRNSRPYNENDC